MRYTIFNSPVTSWTTSKLGTSPFGSLQSGDYSFVRRCSSPELTHRVCERYSKLNEPGNADFYSILTFASNTGARKRERKVQVTHAQLCTFANRCALYMCAGAPKTPPSDAPTYSLQYHCPS